MSIIFQLQLFRVIIRETGKYEVINGIMCTQYINELDVIADGTITYVNDTDYSIIIHADGKVSDWE